MGAHRPRAADLLSILMFLDDYLKRLIDLGRSDAAAQEERLAAFLGAPHGASHGTGRVAAPE